MQHNLVVKVQPLLHNNHITAVTFLSYNTILINGLLFYETARAFHLPTYPRYLPTIIPLFPIHTSIKILHTILLLYQINNQY